MSHGSFMFIQVLQPSWDVSCTLFTFGTQVVGGSGELLVCSATEIDLGHLQRWHLCQPVRERLKSCPQSP